MKLFQCINVMRKQIIIKLLFYSFILVYDMVINYLNAWENIQ